MALKVKAVERLLKFDKNDPGSYRYVLKPELDTSLDQKKVIREAALRSGVSQGVMKASPTIRESVEVSTSRDWRTGASFHWHPITIKAVSTASTTGYRCFNFIIALYFCCK